MIDGSSLFIPLFIWCDLRQVLLASCGHFNYLYIHQGSTFERLVAWPFHHCHCVGFIPFCGIIGFLSAFSSGRAAMGSFYCIETLWASALDTTAVAFGSCPPVRSRVSRSCTFWSLGARSILCNAVGSYSDSYEVAWNHFTISAGRLRIHYTWNSGFSFVVVWGGAHFSATFIQDHSTSRYSFDIRLIWVSLVGASPLTAGPGTISALGASSGLIAFCGQLTPCCSTMQLLAPYFLMILSSVVWSTYPFFRLLRLVAGKLCISRNQSFQIPALQVYDGLYSICMSYSYLHCLW